MLRKNSYTNIPAIGRYWSFITDYFSSAIDRNRFCPCMFEICTVVGFKNDDHETISKCTTCCSMHYFVCTGNAPAPSRQNPKRHRKFRTNIRIFGGNYARDPIKISRGAGNASSRSKTVQRVYNGWWRFYNLLANRLIICNFRALRLTLTSTNVSETYYI